MCWQLSVELFLAWSWRIPSAKCQKLTVTLVGLSIQTNLNYKKIVAASAGLIADARTWVERARNEAQQYTFVYGQKMRVQDVTMRVNEIVEGLKIIISQVSELALHFGDDDSDVLQSFLHIHFIFNF